MTADGRPGWKDGADAVHPFSQGYPAICYAYVRSGFDHGGRLLNYQNDTPDVKNLVMNSTVANDYISVVGSIVSNMYKYAAYTVKACKISVNGSPFAKYGKNTLIASVHGNELNAMIIIAKD